MAEQQDQSERTEEPTPKRLAEARRKGDAPKSQEAIAAAMLAGGALGLWLLAGPAARALAELGVVFIAAPHEFAVDAASMQRFFARLALAAGAAGAGLGALMVAAALLANIGQARPVFTTERMKPSLQKISPLAGAKRIFGPSGLFNFAKGVFKLAIVGALFAYALWPDRALLATSMSADPAALLEAARALTLKLVSLAVAAMIVIAGLDYGFQRDAWKKRLRMTREEIRRELKETEGDPQIKARLRRERETRARRRMSEAVKKATVVIMNPTHYAVALDYAQGAETAPVCVAKGVDDLALRLRDIAREAGVPVVENPPLARALFAGVEIDEEIPLEHYEAVAKVIGFVLNKAKETRGR